MNKTALAELITEIELSFLCSTAHHTCPHICDCAYDPDSNDAIHILPCCTTCEVHGKIKINLWGEHIKECHGGQGASIAADWEL